MKPYSGLKAVPFCRVTGLDKTIVGIKAEITSDFFSLDAIEVIVAEDVLTEPKAIQKKEKWKTIDSYPRESFR